MPPHKPVRYWPIGAIDPGEVSEFFSDEAEKIGVITILWNRQELALRRLFVEMLRPADEYAGLIWDRQPTHHAKRELLALALQTGKLTDKQRGILEWIIDTTKVVADRRNELIHAEYVVRGGTANLHAKVKAPRSNKPPKHQRVTAKDLQREIDALVKLLQATEGAWIEFVDPQARANMDALLSGLRPSQQPPP